MLARLPDGLSFDAGASLAHAAVTAAGLVRHCPLPEESAVVVWGAAGAVGRLLVASLADRRATVIGVASGTRVQAVRSAGAAHIIDRTTETSSPQCEASREGAASRRSSIPWARRSTKRTCGCSRRAAVW